MRCSWINFAFVTSQMGSSFNPPFTCLHQVWLFIPLFSLSLFLSVYLFIRSCFRKFETILTQTRDKKEIQHAYGEQSHLFSLSLSLSPTHRTQKHTHTHTPTKAWKKPCWDKETVWRLLRANLLFNIIFNYAHLHRHIHTHYIYRRLSRHKQLGGLVLVSRLGSH